MNCAALEHILRAAATIANERELVVIGSQAVLGQFPDAPDALLASIAADVYPRHAPGKSDVIDAAMGELSAFHQTFGYYAHGVDDTTATLPAGWAERLVPIQNENTGGAIGWCLEMYDLAASKLVAGRERDLSFVATLVRKGMVNVDVLRERLDSLAVSADLRRAVSDRVSAITSGGA
ncbi:MAG: DUF6036 family nucleotidyltransferase [Acidobacteriota bacterium]